jgi:hypothetical protein
MISVVHNAQNGSVYANVSAIMRLPKGVTAPAVDPAYVRVVDRPKDGTGESSHDDEGPAPDFSDVPF